VDDFARAAGGIEPVQPLSRSGLALSPQPSAIGSSEKAPQHPGFTRRDLESLVSGGNLQPFGFTRTWRESLIVLAMLIVCVLAVAGAVWTIRELWMWIVP